MLTHTIATASPSPPSWRKGGACLSRAVRCRLAIAPPSLRPFPSPRACTSPPYRHLAVQVVRVSTHPPCATPHASSHIVRLQARTAPLCPPCSARHHDAQRGGTEQHDHHSSLSACSPRSYRHSTSSTLPGIAPIDRNF